MTAYQFFPSFAKVFFSYIFYYGICPAAIIFTVYKAYKYYKVKKIWVKPVTAVILVYLLIMPVWGYSLSILVDARIRHDIQDMKGPHFGAGKTIEEISTKYRERRYKFSEVEEYIHFNDLKGKPVITAAYSFSGWWIAYTSTTFYPVPKSKIYLFYVAPDEEVIKQGEKTIYFPLLPSSEINDLFPWTV